MQPKRLKRWKTLRWLLHGVVCRRFNLNAELCAVAGPFLVVANHATNWDPLMVAMSFPDTPLRYGASEHLFRHGFASRSLEWLVAPIPRRKAASGADRWLTALQVASGIGAAYTLVELILRMAGN